MEKTEKAEVAVRPVVYVYGAIAVIIACVFISWLSGISHSGFVLDLSLQPYDTACYREIMFVFFFPWIISIIYGALTRRKFRPAELLVVTSMVYVSWVSPTFYGIFSWLIYGASGRLQAANFWWFKELLAPTNYLYTPDLEKESIWNGMYYGGAVPWGDWAVPLAFAIIYTAVYYLVAFIAVSFFRRQWLDVEDLSYPVATGVEWIIRTEKGEAGRKRLISNIYIWIGVIAGIVLSLELWGWLFIPGMVAPPYNFIGLDLTATIVPTMPWFPLGISYNPFLIGIFLLVPTTMLLTVIVFYVICWWILPSVLYYAGAIGADPGWMSSWGYTWEMVRAAPYNPGLADWGRMWGGGYGWFGYGAFFALIWFPVLITHRKTTTRVLKCMFGKVDKEFEAPEPISYRGLFVVLIVLVVVWIGLLSLATNGLALSGTRIIPILLYIFFAINIEMLIPARLAGELNAAGPVGMAEHTHHHLWHHSIIWWPVMPGSPWELSRGDRALWVRGVGFEYSYIAEGQPGYMSMEMYRTSKNLGIDSKHVFTGMFIAIPLGLVVSGITLLAMSYAYGLQAKWEHFALLGWLAFYPAQKGIFAVQPTPIYQDWAASPSAMQWGGFAIGAIATIILFVLRAQLPWFPLHPIGLGIGLIFTYVPMWLPVIIAFVIKTIAIRVGGAKFYTEKLMPLAIGLLLAFSFIIILGDLVLYSKVL